jgi:hypothetical protein
LVIVIPIALGDEGLKPLHSKPLVQFLERVHSVLGARSLVHIAIVHVATSDLRHGRALGHSLRLLVVEPVADMDESDGGHKNSEDREWRVFVPCRNRMSD